MLGYYDEGSDGGYNICDTCNDCYNEFYLVFMNMLWHFRNRQVIGLFFKNGLSLQQRVVQAEHECY